MRLLPLAIVLPLLLAAACKKGDAGAAGEAGPQGTEGVQGPSGAPGPAGAAGKDGAQGTQGDAGARGPAGADGLGLVPGSRLAAHVFVASDGSKAPLSPLSTHAWRDTMFDQDCTFTLASDATMRCLPDIALGSIWFSDAACSVASVYVQAAIEPMPPTLPIFSVAAAPAQDGGAGALYGQLGVAAAPPSSAYAPGSTVCAPVSGGIDPSNHYWTVTLLPASAFVDGSIQ